MAPLPLIFLDFSGSDCKDQLREIRLPRLSFTTPVITIRLFRGPDIGETVKAQVRGDAGVQHGTSAQDGRAREENSGEAFGEFVVRERIRV